MSTKKLKDVGTAVFYTAGAVSLGTLLVTSGFSKDFVNEAIATAEGGTADVDDYLTVLQVFLSAFPLVAAILISAALLEYDFNMTGSTRLTIAVVVWFVAGVMASGFDPVSVNEALQAVPSTHPAIRLSMAGVALITASYTFVLLVQAFIVSVCTIWSFFYLRDKWGKSDAEAQG